MRSCSGLKRASTNVFGLRFLSSASACGLVRLGLLVGQASCCAGWLLLVAHLLLGRCVERGELDHQFRVLHHELRAERLQHLERLALRVTRRAPRPDDINIERPDRVDDRRLSGLRVDLQAR
jgi:hypothetical protein